MSKKPKFTREEIVTAALSVIRKKGIDALTVQALSQELGSSTHPIFTVFKNMEEVHKEVRAEALKYFEKFIEKAVYYTPAFKQFGMQMTLFALEEPYLYQLLFMESDGQIHRFDEMFANLGELAKVCINILQKEYDLSENEAMELFRNMWIYTYGVSSLCATGMCRFTEEEINNLLGQGFIVMLMQIKGGVLKWQTPHPMPKL